MKAFWSKGAGKKKTKEGGGQSGPTRRIGDVLRHDRLYASSGIIQLDNLHASQNTGSQKIKTRESVMVESICEGVLVEGCR